MKAIVGATLFDGFETHKNAALLIEKGRVSGLVPIGEIPARTVIEEHDGGLIAPGFVDLQVNGGGGVLFNNDISVDGIRAICGAHCRFGTTALLPTLITDTWQNTLLALRAAEGADPRLPGAAPRRPVSCACAQRCPSRRSDAASGFDRCQDSSCRKPAASAFDFGC
jgi:N-acetylglucosamine-6-phosphate deacetylase